MNYFTGYFVLLKSAFCFKIAPMEVGAMAQQERPSHYVVAALAAASGKNICPTCLTRTSARICPVCDQPTRPIDDPSVTAAAKAEILEDHIFGHVEIH